ncbi:hypothetical protein IG631_18475 [Alternaria alternata]|nr:hypothetical protein IG631_18475 [Alternaria alternata]
MGTTPTGFFPRFGYEPLFHPLGQDASPGAVQSTVRSVGRTKEGDCQCVSTDINIGSSPYCSPTRHLSSRRHRSCTRANTRPYTAMRMNPRLHTSTWAVKSRMEDMT